MLIFLVESDSIYRDLSKKDFFEILVIFLDHTKILDHFSDKSLKSAWANWKISLFPTYSDGFRTWKKSLLVPINRSINLLPLFVHNCSSQTTGPQAIAENLWSRSRRRKWILSLRAGGQSRQKATKFEVAQNPEPEQDQWDLKCPKVGIWT